MRVIVDPKDSWVGTHEVGDWLCLVADYEITVPYKDDPRRLTDGPHRLVIVKQGTHIPKNSLVLCPITEKSRVLSWDDARTIKQWIETRGQENPKLLRGEIHHMDLEKKGGEWHISLTELTDRDRGGIPSTWTAEEWLNGESVSELISSLAHHLDRWAYSGNMRILGGVEAMQEYLTKRFSEEL